MPRDSGLQGTYAATIVQQDSLVQINLPESLAKAGVIIKDIKSALQDEKFTRYFDTPKSKQSAFNTAFFNSGVFVFVPDNVKLAEPIHHIISLGENASIVSRNIIIIGKNSSAKIIQNIEGSGKSYYSEATALHAMEDSAVEFVCVQNLGKSSAYMRRHAVCEARSYLDFRNAFFGAENAYARNEIDLSGEGSETNTLDIYFGTGNQKFDSLSLVNHKARHTKSRATVRGALRDSAKLAPHGNIKIEKQAVASDAFLNEHIMLLNSGAEADPVPALEIDTNDVKAGHAASVSQIDKEKVFYLLSRGLNESEARKMIVLGFLEPALKMAESLRMHVLSNLERKWEISR